MHVYEIDVVDSEGEEAKMHLYSEDGTLDGLALDALFNTQFPPPDAPPPSYVGTTLGFPKEFIAGAEDTDTGHVNPNPAASQLDEWRSGAAPTVH